MRNQDIARTIHEVNRVIQAFQEETSGISVSEPWDQCPEWMKQSVLEGVQKARMGATPEELHQSWCDNRLSLGWRYGPIKSELAKTHPCLVSYDELPEDQRFKDAIFHTLVAQLAPFAL